MLEETTPVPMSYKFIGSCLCCYDETEWVDVMQKTVDGKNYYTFEYELTSPNYSSVSFATIAIANGKAFCNPMMLLLFCFSLILRIFANIFFFKEFFIIAKCVSREVLYTDSGGK